MRRAANGLIALTFLVAVLGGWLGVRLGQREVDSNLRLDRVLHHELSLSKAQEVRIEALEATFAIQRRALEAEMRQANHDLAQVIVTDHHMNPAAEQAIGRFHQAMRALQEATIEHVLSMREVLNPAQAAIFDRTVVRVLDADAP